MADPPQSTAYQEVKAEEEDKDFVVISCYEPAGEEKEKNTHKQMNQTSDNWKPTASVSSSASVLSWTLTSVQRLIGTPLRILWHTTKWVLGGGAGRQVQDKNQARDTLFWLQWVDKAFPHLHSRAYFLPAVNENTVPAQGSHVRCDTDTLQVLVYLQKMSKRSGEVFFCLSPFQFGQYAGRSCYAAAAARIPESTSLPPELPRDRKEGDFDFLLIHPHYGLVICEVKTFGDTQSQLNMTQEAIDDKIRTKLALAVLQLDRAETIWTHLISDIAPGLRVTKTITFPNLTAHQVQQAVDGSPQLMQDLCQCLGTTDPADITGLCLCCGHLPDLWDTKVLVETEKWWERRVVRYQTKGQAHTDTYKALVARICGPAATVTVPDDSGSKNSPDIALFPEQIHLLNTAPPRVFLVGLRGTGKTTTLLLMAEEWLRGGNDVTVFSSFPSYSFWTSPNLLRLQRTTLLTKLRSDPELGQVHFLRDDDFDHEDEVEAVFNDLSMRAKKGLLYVIADTDFWNYKRRSRFFAFCDKLLKKVPGLHLWAASYYDEGIPSGWQVKRLSTYRFSRSVLHWQPARRAPFSFPPAHSEEPSPGVNPFPPAPLASQQSPLELTEKVERVQATTTPSDVKIRSQSNVPESTDDSPLAQVQELQHKENDLYPTEDQRIPITIQHVKAPSSIAFPPIFSESGTCISKYQQDEKGTKNRQKREGKQNEDFPAECSAEEMDDWGSRICTSVEDEVGIYSVCYEIKIDLTDAEILEIPRNVTDCLPRRAADAESKTEETTKSSGDGIPFPIFNKSWEDFLCFTGEGGILRRHGSDVILQVPLHAVQGKTDVTVYAAICNDDTYIKQKLHLSATETVVSPLAEFWAGPDFRFNKHVRITLPTCLSSDYDVNLVHVYCITREGPDGEIIFSELRRLDRQAQTPDKETADAYFYFSERGRVHVKTTHFSGYVCTYCGFCQDIGVGVYASQRHENGSVNVAILARLWDKLPLSDFKEDYLERNLYRLVWHTTFSLQKMFKPAVLQLELDVSDKQAAVWQNTGFKRTPQKTKRFPLNWDQVECKKCASHKRVKYTKLGPFTASWMLESQSLQAPSTLEVCLTVSHLQTQGHLEPHSSDDFFHINVQGSLVENIVELKGLCAGLEKTPYPLWDVSTSAPKSAVMSEVFKRSSAYLLPHTEDENCHQERPCVVNINNNIDNVNGDLYIAKESITHESWGGTAISNLKRDEKEISSKTVRRDQSSENLVPGTQQHNSENQEGVTCRVLYPTSVRESSD